MLLPFAAHLRISASPPRSAGCQPAVSPAGSRQVRMRRGFPACDTADCHSGIQRSHCGFTLIELMVVIAIIGIMTALMIPEMKSSFQDALLRSSSRDLINVFDLAYSRAVSLNQTRRVLLDESTGRYLVERQIMDNGRETFVPADEQGGEKGQLDSRIKMEFHRPNEAAQDESPAAEPSAPATDSENAPRGTAVVFYPDGTADAGEIVLRDRSGYQLMLQINPVTARVHVVEMEREGTP